MNQQAHQQAHQTASPKIYLVKIPKWLAQKNGILMEMVGEIEFETAKAIKVKLHGISTPTDFCRHCGRKLTHPVSVLYGIGPICGGHFHLPPAPMEEILEAIKEKVEAISYEGFLPKSKVTWEEYHPEPETPAEEPKVPMIEIRKLRFIIDNIHMVEWEIPADGNITQTLVDFLTNQSNYPKDYFPLTASSNIKIEDLGTYQIPVEPEDEDLPEFFAGGVNWGEYPDHEY